METIKIIGIIMLIAFSIFIGQAFVNELWHYRWYRRRKGGLWYKYRSTGQLPGLYGSFWSQQKLEPHRYYELEKEEQYQKN